MSLFNAHSGVTLLGRMVKPIETREAGGKTVGVFTLAINEGKDEVTFVDVTAWEKTAELVGKYGGKGKTVLVVGRLKQDKWEDKKTGEKRSKLTVVASGVTFCDGGDKPQGGDEF